MLTPLDKAPYRERWQDFDLVEIVKDEGGKLTRAADAVEREANRPIMRFLANVLWFLIGVFAVWGLSIWIGEAW